MLQVLELLFAPEEAEQEVAEDGADGRRLGRENLERWKRVWGEDMEFYATCLRA